MSAEVVVVEDAASLAGVAAEWLGLRIEEAVRARGSCAVALSGGSTPRPVYERLARPPLALRLDWSKIELFFGDERCVPPDHAESNFRMAREALGQGDPSRPVRLRRIEAERADPEGAAADYEAALPERLDVIVLGIGEDGHTASLFPGSPALEETVRRVVAVEGPKPPHGRITVTPPVVAAARSILVVASGAAKAPAVARALEGPYSPREVPAQLARAGTWVLDRDAASRLGRG